MKKVLIETTSQMTQEAADHIQRVVKNWLTNPNAPALVFSSSFKVTIVDVDETHTRRVRKCNRKTAAFLRLRVI